MIIETQQMHCLPPGAIYPVRFAELALYSRVTTGDNVFVGIIKPKSKEYFAVIFPDCHLLELGVYEAATPPGWMRPFSMLSSPLCTETGDALIQALEASGIKREALHLVERFYL